MIRSLLIGLAAGLALTLITAAVYSLTGASLGAAAPVILALAAAVALMHHWKTLLFQTLRQDFRQVSNRLSRLDDQIAETQGLVQLPGFNQVYYPSATLPTSVNLH